jgi:hypothetical protein
VSFEERRVDPGLLQRHGHGRPGDSGADRGSTNWGYSCWGSEIRLRSHVRHSPWPSAVSTWVASALPRAVPFDGCRTESQHYSRAMTSRLLIGTEAGIYGLESDVVLLAGHRITALAGDWAISDGRGLWHLEEDGPVEVAQLDAGPPATCLLPIGDAVLVGLAEGHLVRVEQGGAHAVAAFETVDGRRSWHTPWGGPADVRSMATDDDTVYVNVHVGGILASVDRGVTWSPTALDIDTDVHQVLAVDHRVFAALGHSGLARSQDGGRSWRVATDGLHANYCRAVAVADGRLLLSASTGPRPRRAALYRSSIEGDTFERCEKGLPEWFNDNIDTGCLALEVTTAAFGTADGRVFVSDDAGDSWTEAAAGMPPITALQLTAA